MRTIAGVIIILLLLTENLSGQQMYKIEGKSSAEFEGRQVMLFTFKDKKINSVDTAIVTNQTFHFEGYSLTDQLSILTAGNHPDKVTSLELMLEPGNISVFLDDFCRIGGTPLNDEYQSYFDQLKKYQDLKQKVEATVLAERSDPELEKEFEAMKVDRLTYYVKFLKKNIRNNLGKELFKRNLWGISGEELLDVYSVADEQIQSDPEVLAVIEGRKKEDEKNKKRNQLLGTVSKDFLFYTPSGEMKKLSDYFGKSKYILLDFWASWCGPCIAEIPNIKEIYNEYNSKGLEIISISLDDNKNPWLNAVKRLNMPWPQLCNYNEDKSIIKTSFLIVGVPYIVILSSDGEILLLGGEFRGEILRSIMRQLFNK